MAEIAKKRPEFRNINFFRDLPSYRMPPSAIVSILHRVSGVLIFALLPFIIWLFDTSVSSELSFARFRAAFETGIGFVPGVLVKLVVLALLWSYLHHLFAGLRFVWLDVSHHSVNKEFGHKSARGVLAVSLVLTLLLGAKLFGLY
ncbi:succinate dehydrogenase, cytochrome b556 subunit [Ramlibacter sp.]|uniref:succinate dehydrogenase, cytochrome b556 subunit n=1 Tax=Ramlibacter sp. TaxID=1917967 RepID=UPI002CD3C80E|nr:succinate dehydrogenase, cytochrome b556 subunit [Ramlibacter sp.]HWI81380.1 succinate dehydrogenase, cytochrome b556 subunit [Ramlibacter sp.]